MIEEVPDTSSNDYSIKFVDMDEQMTFDITGEDEDEKFQDGE